MFVGETASQTAERVQRELEQEGANIDQAFQYLPEADTIVGELRKCHPGRFKKVFGKFDNVYFRTDGDSTLDRLS